MIPCVSLLLAAGGAPVLTNASLGGSGGGSLTAGIAYQTDGTTSATFTGHAAVPGQWYNPSGVGTPGNAYFISFHTVSGTAWNAGLVDGTVYPLSSGRTLLWTTSSSLSATVTVSLWADAGGTVPAGTASLNVSIN